MRIEQLAEETRALAEENNRLLREARRFARIGIALRILVWLVVLVVPLLVVGSVIRAIAPIPVDGTAPGLFGLPSGEQLQDVLDAYRGELPELAP